MTSLSEMTSYLWSLIQQTNLESHVVRMTRSAFEKFVRHHFPWLPPEFFDVLEELYYAIRGRKVQRA
jgi:hypothetical protein